MAKATWEYLVETDGIFPSSGIPEPKYPKERRGSYAEEKARKRAKLKYYKYTYPEKYEYYKRKKREKKRIKYDTRNKDQRGG